MATSDVLGCPENNIIELGVIVVGFELVGVNCTYSLLQWSSFLTDIEIYWKKILTARLKINP